MNDNTTISALIVDDEKLARDLIRVYLAPHAAISVVGECANGIEALNAIGALQPDLIFLDVQMPDLNGFELLQELPGDQKPVVIFTTAHDQFALRAFEVNALDYLLKPFTQARFDAALDKAVTHIGKAGRQAMDSQLQRLLADYERWKRDAKAPDFLSRLLIKESKRAFFVKTADIHYLEAAGDYVTLHLSDKQHLVHMSLNELEEKLDPGQFIRIHRSSIVNVDAIKEMQPHFNGEYQVLLKKGQVLKLSRSYKDQLKRLSGLG